MILWICVQENQNPLPDFRMGWHSRLPVQAVQPMLPVLNDHQRGRYPFLLLFFVPVFVFCFLFFLFLRHLGDLCLLCLRYRCAAGTRLFEFVSNLYPFLTTLLNFPSPSISTVTSSPSVSAPTPAGVPVKIRSPGSSVMTDVMNAISMLTLNIISRVEAI